MPSSPEDAAEPDPTTEPPPASTGLPTEAPPPVPAIDLSPERLEAQDALRWNGQLLSELTDAELATAAEGLAAVASPPDHAEAHSQHNWLKLRVAWPPKRVALHLRVDAIVLEWFRRDGIGYQERMNAVLRAYVEAQLEAESHSD